MPNGMKPSGFKMKNSALHASAKYGSPMQANYNKPSPVKVWPIVAKIAAKLASAGQAVRTAATAVKASKAGQAIIKGATKAKEAYDKGGMVKTLADSTTEGAVSRVMAPREEKDKSIIQGEQKSIM